MELNFKLTYNIPKELIKALNITNDTIFCAYYCDGKLYVETVDDDEAKEFAEDSDQDGDFSDSYRHGYEDGYKYENDEGDNESYIDDGDEGMDLS